MCDGCRCYAILKYFVFDSAIFYHVEWIAIKEIVPPPPPPPPQSTLRSINFFALFHCKLSTGLIAGWLTAENQMKFVHFVCFGNKLSCEFIKFNENFVHYALFNSIPFYGGAQNNSKLFWRFFKYFITVVFAITFTACIIVLLAVFDYIL